MSIPYYTNPSSLVKEKEFVYFLGFLWADGYICKRTNSIEINIKQDDFENLSVPLGKFIHWNIFYKQRFINGKKYGAKQIKAQKSLSWLKPFLLEHGYGNKSGGDPASILSMIPQKLHFFWWRGYFDGDGCIALSKNGCRNLAFWSTIDQNWSSLIAMMTHIEVPFKVYLYERKCGNSSALTVTRTSSIIKIRNYLYPDGYDGIGLMRKFEKLISL